MRIEQRCGLTVAALLAIAVLLTSCAFTEETSSLNGNHQSENTMEVTTSTLTFEERLSLKLDIDMGLSDIRACCNGIIDISDWVGIASDLVFHDKGEYGSYMEESVCVLLDTLEDLLHATVSIRNSAQILGIDTNRELLAIETVLMDLNFIAGKLFVLYEVDAPALNIRKYLDFITTSLDEDVTEIREQSKIIEDIMDAMDL